MGATAAAMGYYCSRFSRNPFLLPYSFYRGAFTMAPHFVWQSPRPEPVYYNRVLHDFYTGWEMASYSDARANRSPHGLFDKVKSYWRFYFGPVLSILFLTIPWLWKRRRTRVLLLAAASFRPAWRSESGMPALCRSGHRASAAAGCRGVETFASVAPAGGNYPSFGRPYWLRLIPCDIRPDPGGEERSRILKQLESTRQRHLAIVRYRLDHDTGDEWVYNSADIDNSRVVWAREMDPTSNRALLSYFTGRRVWLVEPDQEPPSLSPYDPSLPPDPPFRFVRLGAEGIQVLRNPEEIRQAILRRLAGRYAQPYRFDCDQ